MPRAIQMQRYGGPEVLELAEIALPALQPDEIRLRVIAAPVNRADIEIRSGNWPIMAQRPFPYTPGLEALGDVVEIGSGVEQVRVGERAITMMQRLGGIHGVRPGGYQELVTVEADTVAIIPDDLDPLAVAALGLAAVTAYNGIRRLDLRAGETIVIHGASGGVGSAAVSIAHALGARVVATTSSGAKDEYLRGIGADEIVHLREHSLTERLGARSVDALLDTIGGETFRESVAALRRGGRLCLVGAASGENLCFTAWDLLQELRLTGYSSENLTGADLRSDMRQICAWLAEGRIVAPPHQEYALERAAEAHALMERGASTGRMLLVP
ncbi:MAG TPA: zinc-binding alcohol dehydrogenase family protein [Herpetosiphonaceae bacterium]